MILIPFYTKKMEVMLKKRNKIISLIISLFFLTANVYSAELTTPKDLFYRFGTSDIPEKKTTSSEELDLRVEIDIKPQTISETKAEGITYADLSIKSMSAEISKSLDIDYNEMLDDLSLLWQGAAMKSDTIKFAIYKLSNPDKDKPDDGAIKKVLTTIAGMSTFLGAGTGNPVLASAALIGGNTLGIMSQDNKALNYKYTQVTDADMIILVRKVDELQQKIVDKYYDYMTSRKLYDLTTKMVNDRYLNYVKSQNLGKNVVLVTDTFYREALDEQIKARGTYLEKRAQLEQLVGSDIFNQFETNLDNRS